jgi:hypothetical protein
MQLSTTITNWMLSIKQPFLLPCCYLWQASFTQLLEVEMTLEQLLEQRYYIKSVIDDQAKILAEIDKAIIELVEPPVEGATNAVIGGYKVCVTGKITRTVNEELLQTAFNSGDLPQEVAKYCFKWKPSLDLRNYRHAIKEQPLPTVEILKTIVTEKPAKPSIIVEPLNEQSISEHSQHQSA